MDIRKKIESAKKKGTRIHEDNDYATKARNTAARREARDRAEEILKELPQRVERRAEEGGSLKMVVCGIGEIRTLSALRRAFEHPGCYVLKALERSGYEAEVSLDNTGAACVNNSLLVSF